jgi:hypothetical protein
MLIFHLILLIFSSFNSSKSLVSELNSVPQEQRISFLKTKAKSKTALVYNKQHGMNERFCILIDMSIHSGLKRFVVWNFKKDTIVYSFLVGHGCCDNSWNDDESAANAKFSNEDGSHCSSLGKYKIGERARSDWGVNIKYVLNGLDKTNNNALKRFIVFHSWEVVSDKEIYPAGTPEGWGCPTISNKSFLLIDKILQKSEKPVLMWMYE